MRNLLLQGNDFTQIRYWGFEVVRNVFLFRSSRVHCPIEEASRCQLLKLSKNSCLSKNKKKRKKTELSFVEWNRYALIVESFIYLQTSKFFVRSFVRSFVHQSLERVSKTRSFRIFFSGYPLRFDFVGNQRCCILHISLSSNGSTSESRLHYR